MRGFVRDGAGEENSSNKRKRRQSAALLFIITVLNSSPTGRSPTYYLELDDNKLVIAE